jgi:shikimate kinase
MVSIRPIAGKKGKNLGYREDQFALPLEGMSRIYLVGFMGAGKTAVGSALAARLDYDFVDLDDRLVKDFGMTIREFFERFGEAVFRTMESEALGRTTCLDRTVIATGGGAFCSSSNRDIIHSGGGRSVFLDVPWSVLTRRLDGDQSERPKMTTLDRARVLYRTRRQHYLCATHRAELNGSEAPDEVAERIEEMVAGVSCGI